jgi:hypothetical protein
MPEDKQLLQTGYFGVNTACQNHDIMTVVAGVEVARDEARGGWDSTLLRALSTVPII